MSYNGVNGRLQALHARTAQPRAPYFALFLMLAADLALCIHTTGQLLLYTQYLFHPPAIRTFLGLKYYLMGKERAHT